MVKYIWLILVIGFVLIVLGFLSYSFIIEFDEKENGLLEGNVISEKDIVVDSDKNTDEIGESESEEQEGGEQGTESGAGGGGGGGSDSSGGTSENECEDVQVPYGLKDFSQEETCNEYDGGICIDKDISCSLTVHNLHSNIGGIFKIKFALFKKSSSEILDYSTTDVFLEPNKLERREFVFNLKNSEGKNAIEETECKFLTESVPKERICSYSNGLK